jgi:general secretion pathway protein I
LRAAGQATDAASELRLRTFARWVGENRLAEHHARRDWLALGIGRGTQSQGGVEFTWREEVIATPNPAFRRVDVFVSAPLEESRSLARLTGFVVRPPPQGQ